MLQILENNPNIFVFAMFSLVALALCLRFVHFSATFEECSFLDCNQNIRVLALGKIIFDGALLDSAVRNVFPKEPVLKTQVMFPAALWLPETNQFLVVVRVFVNDYKSFLYGSMFSKEWNQITTTSRFQSLSLPGALKVTVPNYKIKYSGPEDARLFRLEGGEIYCIFNMLDGDEKRKMHLLALKDSRMKTLFLTNYYEASLPGTGLPVVPKAEKNWAPHVDHNSMNFIYNFADFQVASCRNQANCSLIHGAFSQKLGLTKGGTPFIRFQESKYFFALTYTHFNAKKLSFRCVVYRPTLTVLHKGLGSGEFRHVYTSEPLELEGKPFELASSGEQLKICGNSRIMIACSIASWNFDKDEATVTLNIGDKVPVVAVLKGMRPVIEKIIHFDQNQMLLFDSKCPDKLAAHHFNL